MARIDSKTLDLFVYTQREGALGAVGHDLKLRATNFTVEREGDDVVVTLAADSLKVDACMVDGGEKSVSLMDRKIIEHNLNKDVLETKRHKQITYRGTVTDVDAESFRLQGNLTLKGVEQPLDLTFTRQGERWVGTAILDQRAWGIEPYTTFLGSLRIKPELRVEVRGPASLA